jgi:hypothetical protein
MKTVSNASHLLIMQPLMNKINCTFVSLLPHFWPSRVFFWFFHTIPQSVGVPVQDQRPSFLHRDPCNSDGK